MLEQRPQHYWGISIGESGRYVAQARHGEYIAIGWNELGDLSRWAQRSEEDRQAAWHKFRDFYRKVSPQETANQSGINAGQVTSFVIDMNLGDTVVVRDPLDQKVHIAEVIGPYRYVETPNDGCPYKHRRQVAWIREEVPRDEVPQPLKTMLGALLTVFSLDKRQYEIRRLLGDVELPLPPRDVVAAVRERLAGLTPYEFQEFVGQILTLARFTVVVSEIGPDGGVDIIGSLNAENLAEITLRVQVKRIAGNTGIKDILQLRGTLQEQEHGAFITLGGFTKAARREAEAPGKKKVRLIDGEGFVDLILEHYDGLPGEYSRLLGLKRRQIPLRDQFAVSTEAGGS
jgi:restriction system protein